ncbi:MAG: selenocysteine-specific translation elongation factor [Thermodesulfobacteriota bacterium]
MNENQKNIVIGTAGHVDHGKTALVKALTGIDTDRLKEEKERGMTIEPGFAYLKLPSNKVVSIVDVPGHEKFVKNMLRGISEVDAVLFVVAADDGVMPQTREHLDILRLLGIEQGLIILSKIDLVDKEIMEMAIEDIAGLVRGTFLEGAPIIPCSSKTGEGIEEIKRSIENLLHDIQGKNREGVFRLPIDRVFTLAGYGTVVTGTIVSGKIKQGEEIEISPLGIRSSVRYVQVNNKFVNEAFAGQRVGINLPNVKVEIVKRGMVITESNSLLPSFIINGKFHYLKSNSKPFTNGTKVKFYSGTSEVIAKIILMGKEKLLLGESSFVQLRLANKLSLCPYDRFVIRSLSPVATIGGGMILEVNSPKYKPHLNDIIQKLVLLEEGRNHEAIEMFIQKERYRPISFLDLSRRFGLPQSEIESVCRLLMQEDRIIILEEKVVFHKNSYENLIKETLEQLRKFHEKNPLRDGASSDELRSKISPFVDLRLFESVLKKLQNDGLIIINKGKINLTEFQKKLSSKQQMIYEKLDSVCKWYGFRPMPMNVFNRIRSQYGEKEVDGIVKLMIGEGRLVKLNNCRLIHSETIEKIKKIVKRHIEQRGKIALGESMEVLGVGRTQTQPIFEYLDSIRFTMRIGDYRILHGIGEKENVYRGESISADRL